MATFKLKKKVNIMAVVSKIVGVVLGLWVGGLLLDKVALAANQSSGAFFQGFTLIGFNTMSTGCNGGASSCLNGTVNTTGLLSVVGIVAMAAIVMDFVEFRL